MKKMLVLLVILVMVASLAAGCSLFGKAKELKETAEKLEELGEFVEQMEEYEEKEDKEIFSGQVHTFADGVDLLNTFKEFGYDWVSSDGENVWSIEWEVLGEEEIDGAAVKHVRCVMFENGETKEHELWFNDQWLSVKALVEGEEVEGWDAEAAGLTVSMMAQTYVNYASLTSTVFVDPDKPGVLDGSAYELIGTGSESLNLGSADVFQVKSLWADITWELGLAEVAGKKLYVIVKQGTDEGMEGLVVTRAVAY